MWLYHRFALSLRDVEDLLSKRGISLSYQAIRRWVLMFGPATATRLRGLRPRAHPQWDLDEMFTSIGGKRAYLWRAVYKQGEVLEIIVQRSRDKKAALKLMRKLLQIHGFAPRTLVTDKWRAYGAAARELGLTPCHHRGRWKNNRAENSHQPVRRRERIMRGFKSPAQAQRFLSTHAAFYNHFNARRHLISAGEHRDRRDRVLKAWREVTSKSAARGVTPA